MVNALFVALGSALICTASSYVVYPEAFAQQQLAPLAPTTASPSAHASDDDDTPLPVVIWHGLGDSYNAEGLKDVAKLIDDTHPGTYVHMIQLGDDGNADRSASFLGNVTQQVEAVCAQLQHDNILRTAPAIDAIGFSQGGQFLRAYVEKCNAPPVRTLLTFGSQHNGIQQFQTCRSALDLLCQGAQALLRTGGVWADYVQSRLVPAQYFRDPEDLDAYLQHSAFLADVNNERALKNATYAHNLARLRRFVMVLFADDKTVIPKESGWFAEVNATSAEVTALRDRPIFRDDWIGLKRLDAKGGLVFEEVQGEHMQLDRGDLQRLFKKYLGPVGAEDAAWREEL